MVQSVWARVIAPNTVRLYNSCNTSTLSSPSYEIKYLSTNGGILDHHSFEFLAPFKSKCDGKESSRAYTILNIPWINPTHPQIFEPVCLLFRLASFASWIPVIYSNFEMQRFPHFFMLWHIPQLLYIWIIYLYKIRWFAEAYLLNLFQ